MKMMNSSEETWYYFIKKHPLNEIRLQKLIININSLRCHRGLIPLTMMTTTFRGHRTNVRRKLRPGPASHDRRVLWSRLAIFDIPDLKPRFVTVNFHILEKGLQLVRSAILKPGPAIDDWCNLIPRPSADDSTTWAHDLLLIMNITLDQGMLRDTLFQDLIAILVATWKQDLLLMIDETSF